MAGRVAVAVATAMTVASVCGVCVSAQRVCAVCMWFV